MNPLVSVYDKMGGETVLAALVKTFYQNMDSLEEAKAVRALHAKSLRMSEEKLRMFLSGLFGGPDVYVEKYGHPRLRQRHLPFKIDTQGVQQWLLCMEKAMEVHIADDEVRKTMHEYFIKAAYHMRNQPDSEVPEVLATRFVQK